MEVIRLFAQVDPAIVERMIGKVLDYGVLGVFCIVAAYFLVKQLKKAGESHDRFIDAQIKHMDKAEEVHEANAKALKSIEESNRQIAKHIIEGAVCRYRGNAG